MNHLLARLQAPTPQFWRKLRTRSLAAAAVIGTASGTLASLPQENAFVKLATYALGGLSLMLTGAATVASLAVDDPDQLPTAPTHA